MKKIFSFVAVALMSVSMFAYNGTIPTDADLDFEQGKLTIAIHFSKVCGDVYFVGTYNNWGRGEGNVESFDNCQRFEPVDGFEGWYQIKIEDESASIEGKPIHSTQDGKWSWDYQTGDADSWELIRGTVTIEPGYYARESNLKGYDKTTPVVLVSNAWRNDPCSTIYSNYHIVVDAPLCGGFAPMLIGAFDGWTGTPMIADEANFNYYLDIKAAQGSEYKIVAIPLESEYIWDNELQYFDEEEGSWEYFSNQVLPEGTDDPIVINLDYSDETHYRWAKCGFPVEYKYTTYENWQIKHEGSFWQWTDNMEKVQDGLFKLEVNWTGSGFNVKSDENPIKKDWFALEELTIGEEVIAPVIVDVYLKVVDDETMAIGVGVVPGTTHTITLYTDMTKGTVSGAGIYYEGETCTLTAIPNYGYHFTQWSDGNTDNPRTIQIMCDTTFTAEFAKNIYTISTQAEHGFVSGGGDYEYLSTAQLTATADEHYHFVRWSDWNTNNPRQITVEGDKTYTAIFSIDQHTISAYAEHGRVSGTGTYSYGTNVTLTVIPNVGYEFTTWSDGNTDNPRIVSVTEDATYNCVCTQMTAGKCGNNLYWEYKEGKLIITGTGEMYDYAVNEMPWYLYRDNVQHVEFSAGLTYIGCNAFTNFIRIEEITCFANQSPRVCSTTFDGLSKQYIYLYVPADYIRSYQVNPSWNVFDIRTKSADVTPMDDENPVVTPSDQDVTITWPITDGTDTYTITITKNGEVVCVLTFNANGQLTNIAFAAPGHNGAHQAPAATLTAQGYQFTVTGLNPGTAYDYSVTATDAGGQTLAEHKGNFSTMGGTGLNTLPYEGKEGIGSKYFRNGQILLERNNATYTLMGQKVR